MVSKTLASLDEWLALAEEVLAEQTALQEKEHGTDGLSGFDQLSFFRGSSDHSKVRVARAGPAPDQ